MLNKRERLDSVIKTRYTLSKIKRRGAEKIMSKLKGFIMDVQEFVWV